MTTAGSADGAPLAPREPTVLDLHGVRRVDDYFWLRDRDRPETVDYLRAERGFYDARMAHTRPLRELIFDEMTRRTVPTDQSVRWKDRGSVYYTQTVAGKEYEQFLRVGAEEFTAEVLLDENELAEGLDYFALGVREVSPDGRLLAYSVDLDGSEVYAMHVRDLATGGTCPTCSRAPTTALPGRPTRRRCSTSFTTGRTVPTRSGGTGSAPPPRPTSWCSRRTTSGSR